MQNVASTALPESLEDPRDANTHDTIAVPRIPPPGIVRVYAHFFAAGLAVLSSGMVIWAALFQSGPGFDPILRWLAVFGMPIIAGGIVWVAVRWRPAHVTEHGISFEIPIRRPGGRKTRFVRFSEI